MSKSILITGAGGYIGKLTIEALARLDQQITTLVAFDVKEIEEQKKLKGIHYVNGDIRNADVSDCIRKYDIDTVIHLASIVSPGKKSNRDFEYSVDVLGTENVLKACVANQVKQFVITSSGAAYGYFADNPEWLTETDTIRGNEEFAYACHKRLVENMLASYRSNFPAMQQLILRPGTILGEGTNNQITDLFKRKYVFGIRGSDAPFVFIWDKDVAAIIVKGVVEDKSGIYNVAGDGYLTVKQIAELLDKPYINLPAGLLKAVLFVLQKIGLSQYGANQINFLRYRPVLSNKKLKEEFGYFPRYTSAEVFDFYLKTNIQTPVKR